MRPRGKTERHPAHVQELVVGTALNLLTNSRGMRPNQTVDEAITDSPQRLKHHSLARPVIDAINAMALFNQLIAHPLTIAKEGRSREEDSSH